jgi:hypothetical protein
VGTGRIAEEVVVTYFDESRVEIEIVRHDDSTNDSDGLEQGLLVAVCAPRKEHTLHKLSLVRGNHDVLHKRKNRRK